MEDSKAVQRATNDNIFYGDQTPFRRSVAPTASPKVEVLKPPLGGLWP